MTVARRLPQLWDLVCVPPPPPTVSGTPDASFGGRPDFAFTPPSLEQGGLRLHYVDAGAGQPVLLLHGEPTWSFLYRKMIPILATGYRVIAPDYFGFGRSDKPIDPEFYTYDRHSDSIGRLADALDLAELCIVVQDWGGPIGMRLAAEHQERGAQLGVMNTGVSSGRPPSDAWLVFRDFVRRVGPRLSAGRMVRNGCVTPLADDVVAGYDAPFPVPESKTGMVRFPELVA